MSATVLEATTCLAKTADLAPEMAALRRELQQLRRQVTGLRCDATYWKSRHADALKRNDTLKEELAQAKAEIRKLNQRLFGRKSERRAASGRSNLLEQAEAESKPKRKRGAQPGHPGHGRRDHSHLPPREESIEAPQDRRICPRCGRLMREMADTEDSEQIEIEVELYRRVLRRKRYRSVCSCHGCVRTITAAAPPKLIPKSRLGTSLWVHLLLAKFAFYQPIARVLGSLKQHGLDLPLGSVTDGLRRIEPMLRPVYDALVHRNRQSVFHQADETRWRVFVETTGKTGFRWWLWVFADGQTVIYKIDPSRSHQVPQDHLGEDARGVLLAEEKLRQPCCKALQSLQNHWEGLVRFVDDPGIPMDNNGAERLMRGPAMGRKNYYGCGSKWSGRLTETMFSILATLACWNINGRTWLSSYLDACAAAGGRAPKDIESFLPWNLNGERHAALSDQPGSRSSPNADDTS